MIRSYIDIITANTFLEITVTFVTDMITFISNTYHECNEVRLPKVDRWLLIPTLSYRNFTVKLDGSRYFMQIIWYNNSWLKLVAKYL